MHVRIGIANAKELEFDVDDPEALVAAYQSGIKNDELMLEVEQIDGSRAMVAIGAIVYISLDAPDRPGIGFAAEG